jgi:hypothetical protein
MIRSDKGKADVCFPDRGGPFDTASKASLIAALARLSKKA